MNRRRVKVTASLVMAVFIVFAFESTLFAGFGIPFFGGGEKKAAADIGSLVDKQNGLTKRLYTALSHINAAQLHFATALDQKENIDKLKQLSDVLAKGNIEDTDAIEKAVAVTNEVSEAQNEQLTKIETLNEKQKKEILTGLVPYATGTAHTVILGKEFAEQLSATRDAIKGASLSDAVSIKQKLDVTLAVAPKLPRVGNNLLSTANTLFKICKKSNLDVSDAEAKLGDL